MTSSQLGVKFRRKKKRICINRYLSIFSEYLYNKYSFKICSFFLFANSSLRNLPQSAINLFTSPYFFSINFTLLDVKWFSTQVAINYIWKKRDKKIKNNRIPDSLTGKLIANQIFQLFIVNYSNQSVLGILWGEWHAGFFFLNKIKKIINNISINYLNW